MSTMIYVNLPVRDLGASRRFYEALGYTINETFSDENAAAVQISDTIAVMLLTEPFFAGFTPRSVANAHEQTEVLLALSADDREGVDTLVGRAVAAGGSETGEPMEEGPMYQRSFADLDGHIWEILWMDMSAIQ